MERVMGIEPTLAAWEAAVLPLNYTRVSVRQSVNHGWRWDEQASRWLKPGRWGRPESGRQVRFTRLA